MVMDWISKLSYIYIYIYIFENVKITTKAYKIMWKINVIRGTLT